MDIDLLDYGLPEELIAQRPLPERDSARLLAVDMRRDELLHKRVRDLPKLLPPSLFVVNNTRVIPARLSGRKPDGGEVELLLIERLSRVSVAQERWTAMARRHKRLRPGQRIVFSEELTANIVEKHSGGLVEVQLMAPTSVQEALEQIGTVPLPPYIQRLADDDDHDRYQTIFAKKSGAVAAPTAGLHFTPGLLQTLKQAGHQIAELTLHVGPGTFAPIRAEVLSEHHMHAERYDVPASTVDAIATAKRQGVPVIAVGTTVARALETAAQSDGIPRAGTAVSTLFIYPPYTFRCIDALFTNFHLPRSTLLAMIMAFAGIERVKRAYQTAVSERYRFFSYGDAMLLAPCLLDEDGHADV